MQKVQFDYATKTTDLKRHTRDIARKSHKMEDEIWAIVSQYMVPGEEIDEGVSIGRLVC